MVRNDINVEIPDNLPVRQFICTKDNVNALCATLRRNLNRIGQPPGAPHHGRRVTDLDRGDVRLEIRVRPRRLA